ncbi:MAG: hypothetical protein KAV87_38360 [Desulfobacteraceae bacterium]|nr:hypothetical protein [Desulfobacteraceae bacterium]
MSENRTPLPCQAYSDLLSVLFFPEAEIRTLLKNPNLSESLRLLRFARDRACDALEKLFAQERRRRLFRVNTGVGPSPASAI